MESFHTVYLGNKIGDKQLSTAMTEWVELIISSSLGQLPSHRDIPKPIPVTFSFSQVPLKAPLHTNLHQTSFRGCFFLFTWLLNQCLIKVKQPWCAELTPLGLWISTSKWKVLKKFKLSYQFVFKYFKESSKISVLHWNMTQVCYLIHSAKSTSNAETVVNFSPSLTHMSKHGNCTARERKNNEWK